MMDGVKETATFRVKAGLAEMLKGGVIMDVVTADQARISESAGAVAVMALERVPADIRAAGGVARMADPTKIEEIQGAVTIPVMAKVRIGHFAEAQVLEALEVDYIDESEVLTPADESNHVDKWAFKVPFVCGATNLGEALRRIAEGAAMIRTKGEAGTGNVVEAVRHMRAIQGEIRRLSSLDAQELPTVAKELAAPLELVRVVAEKGGLPVVNFSAGRPHPLVVRAMKLAPHRRASTIAIADATLSEVAKLADHRVYYSSNSPAYVRSHAALLSLVQALAYGVYSLDESAYADRIKAFRLK